MELVVGSLRSSDRVLSESACKFLTHLFFKAIESHNPSNATASSAPTQFRGQVQALLQQLAFSIVPIEDSELSAAVLSMNYLSIHNLCDFSLCVINNCSHLVLISNALCLYLDLTTSSLSISNTHALNV